MSWRGWIAALSALLLVACDGQEQTLLLVKKGEIPLAIRTTGELTSAQTVELGPPTVKYTWQHKLSYLIPEGTWVSEGQKVMAFDAQQQHTRLRDLQNNLATERQRLESQTLNTEQETEQLELDLAQAKMELDKATLKSSNVDNLMARLEVEKLRIERDIAELNYAMAKVRQSNRIAQMAVDREITESEVERLSSEVNEQRNAIAAMEVKAPRDGIVVYIPNNEGNKPAEGDQFSLIQKILELPDLNSLIIETTVDEPIAYKVSAGDRVDIRLDAIPERTFTGKVQSLGKIVRLKSRREPSKVFDAMVTIDNPDTSVMRPGMAARLSIVERVETDAVAIPQHAIIYRDDKAYVRVKTLAGEREQAITIVARQGGEAIVTDGLEQGDEVIL
ncbi:efflux RND transporter periplasmic adaptor subunit [Gilvimarinus algae]|uniref:Efflux RND transporter periplasmic adaptor subunit n=1 Tax=Gilvimarinus algae TaxID=3058037 RepID=A0ABT8TGP2_9GAMM|nr:efflux RND transporter periplasmic adaptor subunit [Gilvimarinus sp. SDUM040014]MDO3383076.1 efflux RND transporter periplasmic adaptor subunit [Gilvimarinus sp. SDUM040014]